MGLRGVDLNLFVVFEALLGERSVTRAARRLSMSQPAVSEALARLRRLMGDELFVRTPGGMAPTPKALELAAPVGEALAGLRDALDAGAPFDPAAARRTFRIAGSDYAEIVVLPALNALLRREAPGLDLRMVASDPSVAADLLDRGEAEFAIDVFWKALPKRFDRARLMSERAVCLARRGHPALAAGGLTLERYLELPHAARSLTGRPHRGLVERALGERGLERRLAVTVTNVLVLPSLLAGGELIATQPERVARLLAQMANLDLHEPPLPFPSWQVEIVWGRGAARDPAAAWLRKAAERACAAL